MGPVRLRLHFLRPESAKAFVEMAGPRTPPEILAPDFDRGSPCDSAIIIIDSAILRDRLVDPKFEKMTFRREDCHSTDNDNEKKQCGQTMSFPETHDAEENNQRKRRGNPTSARQRHRDAGQHDQRGI